VAFRSLFWRAEAHGYLPHQKISDWDYVCCAFATEWLDGHPLLGEKIATSSTRSNPVAASPELSHGLQIGRNGGLERHNFSTPSNPHLDLAMRGVLHNRLHSYQ
jgi:hypothetical protein